MMKPALLVLAAGMGSRYGGLKQVESIGPAGESILDYSVFDALRSGFGKLVFVIRKDIEKPFREKIGKKLEQYIETRYVFQELDRVPKGFQVSATRKKPWGTGHAILVSENEIQEPFAVINADDFYGAHSFQCMADFLKTTRDNSQATYGMVGFILRNTLSEFGTVSRGICELDAERLLRTVVERTRIQKHGNGAKAMDGEETLLLSGDEIVSMNLWGFTPSIFRHLQPQFHEFLKKKGQEEKSEFYIPSVVNRLIQEGRCRVKVLPTKDQWFGITYPQDKPSVSHHILNLVNAEVYPRCLFPNETK